MRPVAGSTIEYGDDFTVIQKGSFANGLIDELGAVNNGVTATDEAESLIATVRMEAIATGTVNLRSEPADDSNSEFLLFAIDDQIPAESVAYGSVSLAIGQNFTLADDTFTVAEDSAATTLDVLDNDTVLSGGGTLSVVDVTQPAAGGTVSLANGVVSFTPAADFNGDLVFTYRVSDSSGIQENANVTMTVTSVNDAPDAVDDTFNVNQDSTGNVLAVRNNDSIAPDTGEELTVVAVGTTSNGGTVAISDDDRSIVYTPPAGFTGTDTFTYTISDGSLTDTATVTVTVATPDNPPTAVDDAFNVSEDDAEAAFDVLGNDTRDVDNEEFVIDSVGTPDQGGSVRFSTDGTQFFYTPAANFSGTEEVTYTIRDTGGGLSVGTVTFTVAGENDAPPVTDLTVGRNRGAGQTTVLELSDLPANVDSGETLSITLASATTTEGGTATVDAATQSIRYTPPADFTGTDTISYTVGDGSGVTSSGTITINVEDFTERTISLALPAMGTTTRVNGVTLNGTNLLGDLVSVPLTYGTDSAAFSSVLPGEYTIEIPAIPFFQNATEPRQIAVSSAADDGDMLIESGIGSLRPEYISIRDWFGSTSRNSILAVVAPGEASTMAISSSAATSVSEPVIEMDATGDNVTVSGTDPNSSDGVAVTPQTLATQTDPRVQVRGEIGGVRLLKIFDLTFASTVVSGGEGEAIAPASASLASEPPAVQAAEAATSALSLGNVQAEGESLASAATTQADIFVPSTEGVSTRTDATVLALEEGDLWLGESLQNDTNQQPAVSAESIDDAMQNVTEELTLISSAAETVAEQSAHDNGLDQNAIDAVLSSNL